MTDEETCKLAGRLSQEGLVATGRPCWVLFGTELGTPGSFSCHRGQEQMERAILINMLATLSDGPPPPTGELG
jgi:hypothetical protein